MRVWGYPPGWGSTLSVALVENTDDPGPHPGLLTLSCEGWCGGICSFTCLKYNLYLGKYTDLSVQFNEL